MLSIHNSTNTQVECGYCDLSKLCSSCDRTKKKARNPRRINVTRMHLEPGDTLRYAGEISAKIYAVSSGSCKTSFINSLGKEQITGFYMPGEIVGLDGLGGIVSLSTITALEPTSICSIPEPLFHKLCISNNDLNNSFMQIISKEISRKQKHVMALAQNTAFGRLSSFIMALSFQLQEKGRSSSELYLSMQRYDIANYLGLAQATLSRLFKQLQDQGYLSIQHRNLTILNRDRLYAEIRPNLC